jgi:hypothetical protein
VRSAIVGALAALTSAPSGNCRPATSWPGELGVRGRARDTEAEDSGLRSGGRAAVRTLELDATSSAIAAATGSKAAARAWFALEEDGAGLGVVGCGALAVPGLPPPFGCTPLEM